MTTNAEGATPPALDSDGFVHSESLIERLEAALATASPGTQLEIGGIRQHLGLTRYTRSRIHQSVEDLTANVWVRAWRSGGAGSAVTGDLSSEGLAAVVARAEAQALHVSGGRIDLPGPDQGYPEAATFFPSTAGLDAASRASIARDHLELAEGADVNGNLRVATQEMAVVNSNGLRLRMPLTYFALNVVARTPSGATFYDTAIGRDVDGSDLDGVVRRAIEGARAVDSPVAIADGNHRVLLDPPAVSMLLVSLGYVGLNVFGAAAAREGRSFIGMNMGEPVASSEFSLIDDPTDPMALETGWDAEGTARRPLTIIDRGVASGVAHDLTSASGAGTMTTGHALPPGTKGPAPISLTIPAGTTTRSDLIRQMGNGLVINRIHPFVSLRGGRYADLSGTTRDGVFVVENGEIVGSARNIRWSNRMTDLFGGVEAVSSERTVQWMDLPDHQPHTNHVPSLLCARLTVHGSQPLE